MASIPAPTYKIRQRHQTFHEAFGGENGSLRAPDPAVLLSVPRVRIHFPTANPILRRNERKAAYLAQTGSRWCADARTGARDESGSNLATHQRTSSRICATYWSVCGTVASTNLGNRTVGG